jgi:FkbM family methyltransferase
MDDKLRCEIMYPAPKIGREHKILSNTLYGNIKRASIMLSKMGLSNIPHSRRLYKKFENLIIPRRPVYLKSIDSYMYLDPNDGSLGGGLLLNGYMEPYICDLISNRVKLGMTCVDVGANIGYVSLLMAKKLSNTGRLYCFEPDPYTFRQLSGNIRVNNIKNASLSCNALSDQDGFKTLYVDRNGRCLNSLYDKVGDEQLTVKLSTLDKLNVDIDVLKIDAQGADGLIVKGGLNVLSRHPPELFIEFWPNGLRLAGTSPDEVLEILHGIGYTIYLVDDVKGKMWRATDSEILNSAGRMSTDNTWYGFADLYCTTSTG